jgi:hypothetical protein
MQPLMRLAVGVFLDITTSVNRKKEGYFTAIAARINALKLSMLNISEPL